MTKCKNCTQFIQCIMCHFQDILNAHDRIEQKALEIVTHKVSEIGKVSQTLAPLDGHGVEYYLRPNGDIIKFIDGHFANELMANVINNHPVPGDDRETLVISGTNAA